MTSTGSYLAGSLTSDDREFSLRESDSSPRIRSTRSPWAPGSPCRDTRSIGIRLELSKDVTALPDRGAAEGARTDSETSHGHRLPPDLGPDTGGDRIPAPHTSGVRGESRLGQRMARWREPPVRDYRFRRYRWRRCPSLHRRDATRYADGQLSLKATGPSGPVAFVVDPRRFCFN